MNTNCILTSANTKITVESETPDINLSVSNATKTESSINVTLGNDNNIVVTTGPKAAYSYTVSHYGGSTAVTNVLDTTSTITLTYTQDGKTCTGQITVHH